LILSEITWLADENIQFPVIQYLRKNGWRVESVKEMGWDSKSDEEILHYTVSQNMGILTQDIDFGELVFKSKKDFVAILRFWPGHISSDVIISHLQPILFQKFDISVPFLMTIEIRDNKSTFGIRIREVKK